MNPDEHEEDLRRASATATEVAVRRTKRRAPRRKPAAVYAVKTYDVSLSVTVRVCEVPHAIAMEDVVLNALRADRRVRHLRMDSVGPNLSQSRQAATNGGADAWLADKLQSVRAHLDFHHGDTEDTENGKESFDENR